MLKIGIDWDDTLAHFNSIACRIATDRYGIEPPLTTEDITSWENTGRASVIKELYHEEILYREQSRTGVMDLVKKVMARLMEIADVYVITAVYPDMMGVRAKQIMEAIPELPESHIILGAAKDLVHFDVLLDDNINNILSSPATYPVLMRRPWNKNMTGILSVNDMSEFLCLTRHIIRISNGQREKEIKVPTVLAFVGPSGSGKNEVIDDLISRNRSFVRPESYTTKPGVAGKTTITEEGFLKADFLEKTRYGGYAYGTSEKDVRAILEAGNNAVLALDMCGAIGMKHHFPTVIIYVDKSREKLIAAILSDEGLSDAEKTLRLLSLETERKNAALADICLRNDGTAADVLLAKMA